MFLCINIFILIYVSIVPARPPPLNKESTEAQVQEWLVYLYQQYPNPTHQLFSTATVMYRDSSHRNNWLATPECSDLHTGAIFTEWLHMRLQPQVIRLGLFMSLQYSWVGKQNENHQYPQHVWAAALRTTPGQSYGKELIFWDNDWERIKVDLVKKNKRIDVVYGLLGGQKQLYNYLKSKKQGKLDIQKILIGGHGEEKMCMFNSVAWIERILQTGGLDEDLVSIGFERLAK